MASSAPLARLRLGIEMSGADDAMQAGMILDIEEMDRIISQFLDFGRTDGGGEAIAPVSLSLLAAEVVEHYRALGQRVATDIAATAEVPLRALGMRRVLNNLIDNALRYGASEVTVTVRTAGADLVLEVGDRGPGIPEGEAERLKQPFTRIETARSGKGGSGLGLAIVDRIVRAHEGRFELLQRQGGGLLARVSLPIAGSPGTATGPRATT